MVMFLYVLLFFVSSFQIFNCCKKPVWLCFSDKIDHCLYITMATVVILGGGVSGLASMYYLQKSVAAAKIGKVSNDYHITFFLS